MRSWIGKYAFGQLLSLILASTGLINGVLREKHALNIPTIQATLAYATILLLATLYRGIKSALLAPSDQNKKTDTAIGLTSNYASTCCSCWCRLMRYRWLLLGASCFDIAASWLVVKAFEGLKLPEVMLCLGLSTPTSLLISGFRCNRRQLVGISVALVAVFIYFLQAILGSNGPGLSESRVWYFTAAITSAICYAISNYFQEQLSRSPLDASEFLLGLGLLGSLGMTIILGCFGKEEILAVLEKLDLQVLLILITYALILSFFYGLIPIFLRLHSAISFNLSLLTSNFFGILGSWLLLSGSYGVWLYISLALLNVGLLVFYVTEDAAEEEKDSDAGSGAELEEGQRLS